MKIFLLLFLLTIIFMVADIIPQNGTAGAQQLLLPVGAKSFSLNDSYVAGIDGIEAMYYNPAGLCSSSGEIDFMFSHMSYIADIGLSYAAFSANLDEIGTFGLSLKSIDIGNIEITTTREPYGTGEFYSPTLLTATLGYSRKLTDLIYAGINTNIIYEKIVRTSAAGVSFDIGVQLKDIILDKGFGIGVVLKNIGPEMKYEGEDLNRVVPAGDNENAIYNVESAPFALPFQMETGLTYTRTFLNDYYFTASASYLNSSYFEDKIKFSGEFNYNNLFFVRGGYNFSIQSTDQYKNLFGPSFGVGIKVKTFLDIIIDYAYGAAKLFTANQMFTVKIGF